MSSSKKEKKRKEDSNSSFPGFSSSLTDIFRNPTCDCVLFIRFRSEGIPHDAF